MKPLCVILGCVLVSIISGCATASNERSAPGDSVYLSIMGYPSLSGTYSVDAEGRIALGRLGFVGVRNATAHAISDRVKALLNSQGLGRPRVYAVVGKRATGTTIDPSLYEGIEPPFMTDDGEQLPPPNAEFLYGDGMGDGGATEFEGDSAPWEPEEDWNTTPQDWAPNEPAAPSPTPPSDMPPANWYP